MTVTDPAQDDSHERPDPGETTKTTRNFPAGASPAVATAGG